ncbi:MAG: helix-turn-helix transcriptional regulator, partial [Flavobacteriales bacterium]|nr:helix-turn-helix transcriptional regulator [Flavobacteriales bacterium]
MYEIHQPKKTSLKKYISEFTILKKDLFKPINYLAFPHHRGSIAFFFQANVTYTNLTLNIERDDNLSTSIIILGKYKEPLLLEYKNFVDEIVINFTPTGLNYFFVENYDKITNKPIKFLKDEEWIEFSRKLFKANKNERISLLEDFLLSHFMEKDLSIIEHIIDKMKNNKSLKLKDLSQEMGISERTINRIFHKYTGLSPKDFKKILRLRNSITMHNKKISLTELCMNNDYYDSSHFTNEFKALTKRNPR